MKFLISLTFLLIIQSFHLKALELKTSCTNDLSFKYMSTKTDYEFVGNLNTEPDEFYIPGTEPMGMWHLSRHGARYPGTDDINEMNDILPKVQQDILNSNNQWLCESDKMKLRNWVSRLKPEFKKNLTKKGQRQQKELGKRLQQRLPGLMKKIISSNQVYVRATTRVRTQQSADSYLNGFLDYMSDRPSVFVETGDDYILKAPDNCGLYINEVDDVSDLVCPEVIQFDEESTAYKNDLETFRQRINTTVSVPNEYMNLYNMIITACRTDYLIDSTESIWCKFLSTDMMKTFSYRNDIDYNCNNGYRFEITQLMQCDLVSNLIESLESFKNNRFSKKAKLNFAHSSTIVPFFTVFGIGQSDENFDMTNISKEKEDRLWKTTELDPMNANIAFVVYKTHFKRPYSKRLPKYYLKIFRNEKAIRIAACGNEKNCNLNKFLRYYRNFVKNCGSSIKVCAV